MNVNREGIKKYFAFFEVDISEHKIWFHDIYRTYISEFIYKIFILSYTWKQWRWNLKYFELFRIYKMTKTLNYFKQLFKTFENYENFNNILKIDLSIFMYK